MSLSPEELQKLRDDVLASADAGTFVDRVINHAWGARHTETFPVAVDAAAEAHNTGRFDLLSAFEVAANTGLPNRGALLRAAMFLTTLLPKLQGDAAAVVSCVAAFTARGKEDGAAYETHRGFGGWCRADSARPAAALSVISSDTARFGRMTLFALEAGAVVDPDTFVPKAIQLSSCGELDTELRAISALGGMDLRSKPALREMVREVLAQKAADQSHERAAAMALTSMVEIAGREHDVGPLVDAVGKLSPPIAIEIQQALAQATWRAAKVSTPELRSLLLESLRDADFTNLDLISQLDLGLMEMATDDSFDAAVEFLAHIIDASNGKLVLSAFDSFTHALEEKDGLLARLIVRWLLDGTDARRGQVAGLLRGEINDEAVVFNIDFGALLLRPQDLMFLCRKVLGYFPLNPVSAASILISALRSAPDAQADQIAEMVYRPLMLNSGKAQQHIEKALPGESPAVQKRLAQAVKKIEQYHKQKKGVEEIRELHPSEHERGVQRERDREQGAATLKAAREQSVFASIIPMSILLHGSASVHYIKGGDGELHRNSMPMASVSTEMEMPRLEVLDPLGLHYMLYRYRSEPRPA